MIHSHPELRPYLSQELIYFYLFSVGVTVPTWIYTHLSQVGSIVLPSQTHVVFIITFTTPSFYYTIGIVRRPKSLFVFRSIILLSFYLFKPTNTSFSVLYQKTLSTPPLRDEFTSSKLYSHSTNDDVYPFSLIRRDTPPTPM